MSDNNNYQQNQENNNESNNISDKHIEVKKNIKENNSNHIKNNKKKENCCNKLFAIPEKDTIALDLTEENHTDKFKNDVCNEKKLQENGPSFKLKSSLKLGETVPFKLNLDGLKSMVTLKSANETWDDKTGNNSDSSSNLSDNQFDIKNFTFDHSKISGFNLNNDDKQNDSDSNYFNEDKKVNVNANQNTEQASVQDFTNQFMPYSGLKDDKKKEKKK